MPTSMLLRCCARPATGLEASEFETTLAGFAALSAWTVGYGPVDAVGIEGTGAYGAGLARFLNDQGVELVEVTRPDRQARRAQGKSDPVDTEAAASGSPPQ